MAAELGKLGWAISHVTLPKGFPRPDASQRAEAACQIARLADGTILLVDQLVLGVLPEVARRESQRLKLAMIVHHPLALEDLSDQGDVAALRASEQEALAQVALVIVPSEATARILVTNYAVPVTRIVVAEPGTDQQAIAPGGRDGPLSLLSIGSVVPRKAHELLVDALAGLTEVPWHLTIVGDILRHPLHVEKVRAVIAKHGLGERVPLTGGIGQKALEAHWQSTNVYVASSRHEGYGMAIAEALSRAIPVVSTDAGAVGEWVDREAVRLVPTGDLTALREAFGAVLKDARVRERMREAAKNARTALPTWSAQASRVDAKLQALVSD